MGVKFLSQIQAAPNTPALTDTLVGVGGGTTDYQYTLSQVGVSVGGYQAMNSNPTFYYSSTGSNSNPGTMAEPFADPQFAVNYAALFNYQGLYGPTVQDLGGTYDLSANNGLSMPPLVNSVGGNFTGAGHSSTLIKNGQSGIHGSGQWTFQGFTTDTTNSVCFGVSGFWIWTLFDDIYITDSSNSGSNTCFNPTFGASIILNGSGTFTFVDSFGIFATPFLSEASFISFNANIVLPVSSFGSGSAWISDAGLGSGTLFWQGNIVTNSSSYQGSQAQIEGNGFFNWRTDNGLLSDVPGVSTGNAVSNTVIFYDLSNNIFGDAVVNVSGHPTTSNMLPNTYLVVKDTTQNTAFGCYSAQNDAGTVCYQGAIGKFLVSALPTGLPVGTEAWATDLTSPTFTSVASGSGSVFGPVYFDGTNWRCG